MIPLSWQQLLPDVGSSAVDYDLHVAVTWYLYCIGCDLLTKIQRSSQNYRLTMIMELFLQSSCRPLLRITYCKKCVIPFAGVISSASWTGILINRTIIQESKLWERLITEHGGLVPASANGSYFVVENPYSIILSTDFSYEITDYGRDYYKLESRYPALTGRELGRFETLRVMDYPCTDDELSEMDDDGQGSLPDLTSTQ